MASGQYCSQYQGRISVVGKCKSSLGGELTSLWNELTSLWNEIDHYMPPDANSVDRKYVLQLRVFQFLMGLNPEYESLRGQLIHREKTLTFQDALRSARIEESRVQQVPPTASAFVIQQASMTRASSPNPTARGPSPRQEESPRGDPSLFCNYCKKRGHSKETFSSFNEREPSWQISLP